MSDAGEVPDPAPDGGDEAPQENTVIACNSNVQKLMDMLSPLSDKVGSKYSS